MGPNRIALVGQPYINQGDCVLKWADNVIGDTQTDDHAREHALTGAHVNRILDRFVIENLTLDGNFLGQGNLVGPHYREGYKSSAIKVAARTGRVRNCLVRNFGAQGPVPWSSGFTAGVEAFPISVVAADPAAQPESWPGTGDPDSHAWVIEDNEVCQLHFRYQGYATAIIVKPQFTGGYPTPDPARVAVVRRNVVRGVPIAFGSAATSFGDWAGRVRFEDNVVLNCSLAFNTDTGAIRELDFHHNLFLDVGAVGYFGEAGVGQGSAARHAHLSLMNNAVRLRGRSLGQEFLQLAGTSYQDYYGQQGPPTTVSDPSFDLWRPNRAIAAGLLLQGRAQHLTVAGNHFTTWPSGGSASADHRFLSVPYPLPVTSGDGWWHPAGTVPAGAGVEPTLGGVAANPNHGKIIWMANRLRL